MVFKKFILVSLIFIFISFIGLGSSASVTYNFNSTFEGINMFAYEWETTTGSCSTDQTPPNGGPIPTQSGCTKSEGTTNAGLDSLDGSYFSTAETGGVEDAMQLYIADITGSGINKEDITLVQWNASIFISNGGALYSSYIWNSTSSDWIIGPTVSGTGLKIFYPNTTDYNAVNGSNLIHMVLVGENDDMDTDFIELKITYNPSVSVFLDSPVNVTNSSSLFNEFDCSYSTTSNGQLNNGSVFTWYENGTLFGTNSSDITGTSNFTNLSITFPQDGLYYWSCQGNITDNNPIFNSTNFTINIDTNPPKLVIENPVNLSFIQTAFSFINYTILDPEGNADLTSCRWSKDGGSTNTSLNTCQNTSDTFAEGENTIFIWVDDDAGNTGYNLSVFTVDLTDPTASYVSPTLASGLVKNQNYIEVNLTGSDTNLFNLTSRLYDSTGAIIFTNISKTSPHFINYTGLSDGLYFWNATVNDSSSRETNLATRNITLDSIFPAVNLTDPITTQGSQTITFIHNASDINTLTCKYNIIDSLGLIDVANTTVTCNDTSQATVSSFGTFNLTFFANDGINENSTLKTFTVVDNPTVVGGGGGSTLSAGDTQVPRIAIINPNNITEFNDLDRAIIFSRIFEKCGSNANNIASCILSNIQRDELLTNLTSSNVEITIEELNLFFENYKKGFLEEVLITKSLADEYGLFVGLLGQEGSVFGVNPRNIDSIFPAFFSTERQETISSNKVLANCTVIEGLNLECETRDTIAILTYKVPPGITSTLYTFEGKVDYIDVNGNVAHQNVRLRIIRPTIQLYFVLFFGLFLAIVIFRERKSINKKFKDLQKSIIKPFK